MPISARMSLWGLYKYDSTILDNLSVPAGMDSDNLKQNLLVETSSLSVLYPDPTFMKMVIGLWSVERADVWNKLYETTQLTYNPIENYDRIEETEESSAGVSVRDASHSRQTSISESAAQNNSENVSETIGREGSTSNSRNQSGSSTATNSNTAYNSATFADTAKTISSGEDQVTDVGTNQENTDRSASNEARSDSVRNSSGDESLSENGRESRNDNRRVTSRIHGNIGVTTSQQMIEAQRDVVQFCMTEFIINDFIQRFCVMVY